MTLIYILLCLFVVFILVPLVKAFLFVRKIRKQNKDFFEQMRRASSQTASGSDNSSPGGAQAGPQGFGFDPLSFFFFDQMFGADRSDASGQETKTKSKRIASDVGEYVDFQDIEGEYRSYAGSDDAPYSSNDSCEGYIQDVEWEDIDNED